MDWHRFLSFNSGFAMCWWGTPVASGTVSLSFCELGHGCVSYNFGFSMKMDGVDHTMMPFSFFLILLFISFFGCNSPSTSLSPNCGGPCSPAAMIGLNFQHLGFKFKHLLTTFLIKFLHWPPENNKYYCHV